MSISHSKRVAIAAVTCSVLTSVCDAYSPSLYVRRMHNMPHLDADLSTVSNDFDISPGSQNPEYLRSLVVFPAILAVIGVLGVLGYMLGMCCRIVCKCCRCGPKDIPDRFDFVRKRQLTISCVLFIVIIVAFNFTILAGNNYVNKGVRRGIDGVDFIGTTFQDLTNSSDVMVTEAGIIASDVDQASTVCAGANNLTPLVEQYAEAAAGLTDSLGNSADDVFSAKRTIREWGVRKKNSVIWVCFVCLLALPGVFVAGYICHSACTEKVAMMFSTLVTLSLVLLCPLIMVLLVGLADFCMDPNGNALHVMQAEEGDAVYLTVSYYLECRGANPLSDEIAQSTAATSLLSQEVHTLTDSGGDCEANADLLHVLDSIKVVDVAIDDILALFDCQPVMDQWNNMMHEGVCHDMFDGFYLIWQALYFCACFLLALCIAASLLYQYFTMDAILVDSRDDQENTAVLEIKNSHDQTLSKHDKSPSKSLELTFGEVYVERDDSLSTQAQVRYTGSYHSPRSSDASAPPESFMMV